MKKNVWLINHYATEMYENNGGRHFFFAKYLKEKGYNPVIICSSFLHNGTKNYITDNSKYKICEKDGIPFIFIRTSEYKKNGKSRLKNMIQFYFGVKKAAKSIAQSVGKPDVLIGSSVHPLTCVAGIKLKKTFGCKVISEIRDLWPETLVMFGAVKENGLLAKILYAGEKWIYKKSDNIIFTMEGGKQYIIDRGWDKDIELSKVFYINNGVDLQQFDTNCRNEVFDDYELDSASYKIIYTGTVSKANGIDRIISAAEKIQNIVGQNIIFLIYGSGAEQQELQEYCEEKKIQNVFFKGKVNKAKIPYVLSKGNVLIVNYAKEIFESKHNVLRYGGSHNKLFEYLAAGKAILYAQPSEYNLVERYQCGLVLDKSDGVEELVNGIVNLYQLSPKEYEDMCKNARSAVTDFEYSNLVYKLIGVIEE